MNENNQLIKQSNYDIITISNQMLEETKLQLQKDNVIKLPISEIATLGGSVSSLIPSLRTITQTATVDSTGLYRIANQAAGDTLKIAKNGNSWGAMKTATGGSKMVQLASAGPLSATTQTIVPIDPVTIAIAAMLYAVDKKMDSILEMEKKKADM